MQQLEFIVRARKEASGSLCQIRLLTSGNHRGSKARVRALRRSRLEFSARSKPLILIDGSKALRDREHRRAKKRASREKNDDGQRPKARASLPRESRKLGERPRGIA